MFRRVWKKIALSCVSVNYPEYKQLLDRNKELETRLKELSYINTELSSNQQEITRQKNFIDEKNKTLHEYQDRLVDYLTSLNESKDQLAIKEAENTSILNALRQNYFMAEFDLQGKITWIAPKTARYFSLNEADIIGRDCFDSIVKINDDDRVDELRKLLWLKVLKGESVSVELELKYKNRDLHLSITYAPILDAEKKPYKVISIAVDISNIKNERKKMAEINSLLLEQQDEIRQQNDELQQQKEEITAMNELLEDKVKERTSVLEQKNKQLAEYAFINAHLLRSPVSSILGLINLLEYEKLSTREKEIYAYMKRAVSQLDRMVFKINGAIQQNKAVDREFFRE